MTSSDVRVYTKEIHCCADCPSCDWQLCTEMGKKVDINTLPSFCPLEKHYDADGIDPISILPKLYDLNCITDELSAFFYGNIVKYIWRIGSKGNPEENIDKAIDYLNRLKERMCK